MIIQGYAKDAHNMQWAKTIGEKLHAHYPGHLWAVTIEGGCAIIKNLRISSLYGYILKLKTVYADPDLRCVITAGGELLERAAMKRGLADGRLAQRVEGVADKHQPFRGIII